MFAFPHQDAASTNRRHWRWLALAMIVLQLSLAGIYVVEARRTSDQSGPVPQAPQPPIANEAFTFDAIYQDVLDYAQSWAGDAQPIIMSNQVDFPADGSKDPSQPLPAGGWLRFVFYSANGAGNAGSNPEILMLMVERNARAIVGVHSETWPSDLDAVMLDPMDVISPEEAILAAEAGGGEAHRMECPAQRNTARAWLDGRSGGPKWVVSYTDNVNLFTGMFVTIDATSGDVISSEVRSSGC